ncbi:hypothetical protein [Dyella amyloliquefaciens]|uniref:hypothetical protein n=1 Tax=Dyella amyloliquefaciens TaxID=1770545 RepID=UPI001E424AD2|nr:hypothetical protein [Dyella amyloliquefaciens]
MSGGIWRHPGAWAPLVMSLAALVVVVGHLVFVGTARGTDEGASAHLFQLLIAAQVPVVGFFAIRWLRRMPGHAVGVMALQAAAVAVACAPVWYFQW